MKSMLALFFSICCILSACKEDFHTQDKGSAQSSVEIPRFKTYHTENIWTTLLLDTQTGRLWQVQFSTSQKGEDGVVPIQTSVLDNHSENGRFILSPTGNMWTFILTDSQNGALWHCQFGMKDDERFCQPLDLTPKDVAR